MQTAREASHLFEYFPGILPYLILFLYYVLLEYLVFIHLQFFLQRADLTLGEIFEAILKKVVEIFVPVVEFAPPPPLKAIPEEVM